MPNADAITELARQYEPGKDIHDPTPPGWKHNPSSIMHRLFVVAAACAGAGVAIWLTLFQVSVIPTIWEPFFGDGSRRILTGVVARVLPVPDASLGALGYLAEVATAIIGGRARWRTMPWAVLLFSVVVIPFGLASTTLFILQPTLYSSWCTLCLVSVAISLSMVPYAWGEFVATWRWLRGRRQAGAKLLPALMGR